MQVFRRSQYLDSLYFLFLLAIVWKWASSIIVFIWLVTIEETLEKAQSCSSSLYEESLTNEKFILMKFSLFSRGS